MCVVFSCIVIKHWKVSAKRAGNNPTLPYTNAPVSILKTVTCVFDQPTMKPFTFMYFYVYLQRLLCTAFLEKISQPAKPSALRNFLFTHRRLNKFSGAEALRFLTQITRIRFEFRKSVRPTILTNLFR